MLNQISIYLSWFFFFTSIYCDVMKNKLEFYRVYNKKIVTERTYTIDMDNDGLYMSARGNIAKNKPGMSIPTNFFYSSCHFYPFKEEIAAVLKAILKYDSEEERKRNFELYNLIFYLMYHRVGNKQMSLDFYKNVKNMTYTSDFYNYDKTPDEIKFFNEMIIKNMFYSIFYLPDDDLELLKEFGMQSSTYTHAMYVYNQLHEYSKTTDERVIDFFQDFFSEENEKIYKYIAGFVFRYNFPVKIGEFERLFKTESIYTEFTLFQDLIHKNIGHTVETCYGVMPFVELLRHHHPKNQDDITRFSARIYDRRVELYFNKVFKDTQTLTVTYGNHTTSNDNLMIIYGQRVKNNKYNIENIEVHVDKSDIDNNKASVCHSMKCTSFDIYNLLGTTGQNHITSEYPLLNNKLNLKMLSLFKLKSIPSKRFNQDKLYPYFASFARLDYETETLSMANYYEAIIKKGRYIDTKKLLEDYSTLKVVQNKYPKYEIYLQAKINILAMVLEKKIVLINQLSELFNYQHNTLRNEYDKLKANYIK